MRVEYTVFTKEDSYGEESRKHFNSGYEALNFILGTMQTPDTEVLKVVEVDHDRMTMREMVLKLEGFSLSLVAKPIAGQFD